MKQGKNQSRLPLAQKDSHSLFTLQSNLLAMWTENGVDQYYQNTVLAYLDQLSEQEAIQEIVKEQKRTLENRSQYNIIKESLTGRERVLQAIYQKLQDEGQTEAICQQLDDLRKANLTLCQSILQMKEQLSKKGVNMDAICNGYCKLFEKLDKDNTKIKKSFLSRYMSFGKGFDPFLLTPYETFQQKGFSESTPKPVCKLFKMNISYVYRLIKAKNELLSCMSCPCIVKGSGGQFGQNSGVPFLPQSINNLQQIQEEDEYQKSRRSSRQQSDLQKKQPSNAKANRLNILKNPVEQENKQSKYPRKLASKTIEVKQPASVDRKKKYSVLPSISNKKSLSVSSHATIKKSKVFDKNLNKSPLLKNDALLDGESSEDEVSSYRKNMLMNKSKLGSSPNTTNRKYRNKLEPIQGSNRQNYSTLGLQVEKQKPFFKRLSGKKFSASPISNDQTRIPEQKEESKQGVNKSSDNPKRQENSSQYVGSIRRFDPKKLNEDERNQYRPVVFRRKKVSNFPSRDESIQQHDDGFLNQSQITRNQIPKTYRNGPDRKEGIRDSHSTKKHFQAPEIADVEDDEEAKLAQKEKKLLKKERELKILAKQKQLEKLERELKKSGAEETERRNQNDSNIKNKNNFNEKINTDSQQPQDNLMWVNEEIKRKNRQLPSEGRQSKTNKTQETASQAQKRQEKEKRQQDKKQKEREQIQKKIQLKNTKKEQKPIRNEAQDKQKRYERNWNENENQKNNIGNKSNQNGNIQKQQDKKREEQEKKWQNYGYPKQYGKKWKQEEDDLVKNQARENQQQNSPNRNYNFNSSRKQQPSSGFHKKDSQSKNPRQIQSIKKLGGQMEGNKNQQKKPSSKEKQASQQQNSIEKKIPSKIQKDREEEKQMISRKNKPLQKERQVEQAPYKINSSTKNNEKINPRQIQRIKDLQKQLKERKNQEKGQSTKKKQLNHGNIPEQRYKKVTRGSSEEQKQIQQNQEQEQNFPHRNNQNINSHSPRENLLKSKEVKPEGDKNSNRNNQQKQKKQLQNQSPEKHSKAIFNNNYRPIQDVQKNDKDQTNMHTPEDKKDVERINNNKDNNGNQQKPINNGLKQNKNPLIPQTQEKKFDSNSQKNKYIPASNNKKYFPDQQLEVVEQQEKSSSLSKGNQKAPQKKQQIQKQNEKNVQNQFQKEKNVNFPSKPGSQGQQKQPARNQNISASNTKTQPTYPGQQLTEKEKQQDSLQNNRNKQPEHNKTPKDENVNNSNKKDGKDNVNKDNQKKNHGTYRKDWNNQKQDLQKDDKNEEKYQGDEKSKQSNNRNDEQQNPDQACEPTQKTDRLKKNQPIESSRKMSKNYSRDEDSMTNRSGAFTVRKQVKMKPCDIQINQFFNFIKTSRICEENRKEFESGNWKSKMENRVCYFTKFFLNEDLASFGVCSPMSDGDYEILYWGVIEEVCSAKLKIVLIKRYLEYLQKFTSLEKIYVNSDKFAEFGFSKDRNFYSRKRMAFVKKQRPLAPFLSLECSNICFKQKQRNVSLLYSEQIDPFDPAKSTAAANIGLCKKGPTNQFGPALKFFQDVNELCSVNTILDKEQLDTYQISNEIKVGLCNMVILKQNFAVIGNFYFQKNYFISQADIFYLQEANLYKIATSFDSYSLIFAKKNNENIQEFASKCCKAIGQKSKNKSLFGFKIFTKQLYGRLKNEQFLAAGCYGNWDVVFAWNNQLKGMISNPMPPAEHILGPENFFVGFTYKEELLYAFEVTSGDLIF